MDDLSSSWQQILDSTLHTKQLNVFEFKKKV